VAAGVGAGEILVSISGVAPETGETWIAPPSVTRVADTSKSVRAVATTMFTSDPSASLGDEWDRSLTQRETALELPFFTIEAINTVFDHVRTAPLAACATPTIAVAPRAVFASTLSFAPSLPDLGVDPASPRVFRVGRSYAKREFASSVREDGLTDVSRTDDRPLARADGPDGHAFRYEAAYPFDADALLAESASGRLLVATAVWAGIWPTDESYAMAGGIYPMEDLRTAVERQAPGGTLATTHRLDPDPERDREQVFEVLRTIGV
jgi:hypothetical protein